MSQDFWGGMACGFALAVAINVAFNLIGLWLFRERKPAEGSGT
jgi:hypothetical protein